jgi:Ras-related protein Rab-2A
MHVNIHIFVLFDFFKIWDTAGQERFRSMTSAFYAKAQGVVIAFDVTMRETFNALSNWIHDIREVLLVLL